MTSPRPAGSATSQVPDHDHDHDHDHGACDGSPSGLPRRRYPCAECPWRRDVLPGMFGRDRFDALAATAGRPGHEVQIGEAMFACHKSAEGAEEACAGWLAVAGAQHLGVRLAVVQGRLDPAALEPGEAWPELFDSYQEMTDTQAD